MSIETKILKLRTDGIYVQFGYRPWISRLGNTYNCWYNLLKAVDDKNLILLGCFNRFPFFEIDHKTHKPSERKFCLSRYPIYDINIDKKQQDSYNEINYQELKSNLIDKNTNKMNLNEYIKKVLGNYNNTYKNYNCYFKKRLNIKDDIDFDNWDDFEVIKDYYSYLNLDLNKDNFDPINIVKKLENFNWDNLADIIQITGIEQIINYYHEDDKEYELKYRYEDDNKFIKLRIISSCLSSNYNEPFSLVTYSDDTNSFYIKYSHRWIEGNINSGGNDHYNYGNEETNKDQIPFKILTNSFKFTFVPFDLSEKSIWVDEYIKWKEKLEYHKYYLNEKDNKVDKNEEDYENFKDIESKN